MKLRKAIIRSLKRSLSSVATQRSLCHEALRSRLVLRQSSLYVLELRIAETSTLLNQGSMLAVMDAITNSDRLVILTNLEALTGADSPVYAHGLGIHMRWTRLRLEA